MRLSITISIIIYNKGIILFLSELVLKNKKNSCHLTEKTMMRIKKNKS